MVTKLAKTRWILLLFLIGGCVYFYLMNSYASEQNQVIVLLTTSIVTTEAIQMTTTVTTTTITITNATTTTISKVTAKKELDFVELSRDLREYSLTRNEVLKQKLFPWWFDRRTDNNSKQYHNENDTSKGIVICTGNKHFRLTLVALSALATIENELPIEVVYSTSNDLSLENRQELEKSFPKIRLVDLSLTSFNDSHLELRGWEIKPFSVLASQFRHVLLMDADVLFLEKPSILFENPYYLKTGTLFFYDRPNLAEDTTQWIKTLLVDNNNHSIPHRTQESGVVVIDKARVLTGLLSTCKLNDHQEREKVTYQRLLGDKDTWWLGFHIIQMPYSFIPTLTASIGQIMSRGSKSEVCGHILHLDENSRPIWWNGGTFRNRYVDTTQLLRIEGWLYEGHWRMATYSCLSNTGQTPQNFTQNQQQLINSYLQITRMVFNIN